MELGAAFCLSVLIPLAFSEFEKFKAMFYLGEYTCPVEHVVFEVNASYGMVDCMGRCKIDSNCSGVFYQEGSTCIGCTTRNVNEFLPAPVHHVYYRRSERGELTCSASHCVMYQMVTDEQNWTQAEANCISLGSFLVKIDSQDEQDRLVNFVLPYDTSCTWIGGSKRVANGTFFWLDGSRLSDGYNNWHHEEPNAVHPDEDCIEMWKTYNFMWNNNVCDKLCYSVCEFN